MNVRTENNFIPLSPECQRQAWLELVGRYDWEVFATLTFRDEIEPWLARKRFDKWIGSLNCYLFGWRYRRKGHGIRYAVGVEYQKRGIVHFHVLMSAPGLKDILFKYMHNLWQSNGQRNPRTGTIVGKLVNGYAWIEFVSRHKGVSHYITKYVSKGGEIDMFVPRNQGQVANSAEAAPYEL